ncbi:MAG: hypothetical protein ACTSX7_11080 [Alphaproteobacteria bacterium]
MSGFTRYEALISKLGKHKISKSCLYINKLADVDKKVLETLVARPFVHMKKQYKV